MFYATATVRERSLADATAAVSVIDRGEIEASGAATGLDLLAGVPGVSLVSGGTAGALSTVQLRGGDPNFTLVLIDGVAVNDGSYQVGEVFDFAGLPLSAVDRIEVVRGPLSAHYGSTGLAGVVQLFTRSGVDAPRFGVDLGLGDASMRRGAFHLAGAGDRFDTFWHASYEEEARRVAAESRRLGHLQGQLRFAADDRTSLRLASRAADWQSDDYPDASGGPRFGDGALRHAEHRELGASLRWQRTAAEHEHRFEGSTYRHNLTRDSPAIDGQVPAAEEETRFERAHAAWVSDFHPGSRWQLGVGADVEHDAAENRSRLFLPPFLGGEVRGDYDRERTQGGVFSELLLRFDRLTLEFSARQDWPEGEDPVRSPRAGLVWQPTAAPWRLRASWGRAYKLPSYFALASPVALGGNDALRPERSEGADFALAGEGALGAVRLAWELGLFAQRFSDLVDFDFATFSHVNRGVVEARGIEGWTQASVRDLRFQLNLTHQKVEDRETGAGLRHRPRTAGQVAATWSPQSRLHLHADFRFASSSLDQQIPVVDRFLVDGYRLLGLAASWQMGTAHRLALRLDNLTDERYETLIGFPGPGRGGRLTWSWSLGPR